MRILISAYACEPGMGSEPEVGWQMATGLARLGHEVWVITRANNRPGVERVLRELNLPNLHFAYYDLPTWGLWLKRRLGVNLYYRLWQSGALPLARHLHAEHHFDQAQHATFVTVRHPTFLRHLGVPYILGPVAGGEHAPAAMLRGLPIGFQLSEGVRTTLTRMAMLLPAVIASVRGASRVLVTSPQTAGLLPSDVHQRAEVRLAISSPPPLPQPASARQQAGNPLRALFVGRVLHWKGVHLGLMCLDEARKGGTAVRLTIHGDGPARPWLEARIERMRLASQVTFKPWVSREQLGAVYAAHDVLLFPSLRDSGGMVTLEAMQHGLPVVCLSLGGPGQIVDESCGMAVSASTPAVVARAMADELVKMAHTPLHYAALSAGALARVRQFEQLHLLRHLGY